MKQSLQNQPTNVIDIGERWRQSIVNYNNTNDTKYDLRLLKNKARGNCLFISIEQALPQYNRNLTRKIAVDHLLENKIMTTRLLQQNINDYNSDFIDNTSLLNGIGWPQGGPFTILETITDNNPILQKKARRQLKNVLGRATYYADNELIQATEDVLDLGIILLSDTLGEISWHYIDTSKDKYIVIYNYDGSHYELVEITNDLTDNYINSWNSWNEIPKIIKDLIPNSLLKTRDDINRSEYTFSIDDHLYLNYPE